MKIIITESQLEKGILNWLNSEFGDLKSVELDEYPNQIFFVKDGVEYPIIDYRTDSYIAHVNYDVIWEILQDFFGLTWEEIKTILFKWVKTTHDLDVIGVGPKF